MKSTMSDLGVRSVGKMNDMCERSVDIQEQKTWVSDPSIKKCNMCERSVNNE